MNEVRNSLINTVCEYFDRHFKKEDLVALKKFTEIYFKDTNLEVLLKYDQETLALQIYSLRQLMQTRKTNAIKIKIFSPTLEKDQWYLPHTVVQIIQKDAPFLIDSLNIVLRKYDIQIHTLIHPVIKVARDSNGTLLAHSSEDRLHQVDKSKSGVERIKESCMYIEIDMQDEKQIEILKSALQESFEEVHNVVDDKERLQKKVGEVASIIQSDSETPATVKEDIICFLNWIKEKHFIFLGFTEVTYQNDYLHTPQIQGESLGILKNHTQKTFSNLFYVEDLYAGLTRSDAPIRFLKTNQRSNIHKTRYMQAVCIKKREDKTCTGEYFFIGIFSSSIHSTPLENTPIIAPKVRQALVDLAYEENSYMYRAGLNVLRHVPREDLFRMSLPSIKNTVLRIIRVQEQHRIAILIEHDLFGRTLNAIAYIPNDQFSKSLAGDIAKLIEKSYKGKIIDEATRTADDYMQRLHFTLRLSENTPETVDVNELESHIREIAKTWNERLQKLLTDYYGESKGNKLNKKYGTSFTEEYTKTADPHVALSDIAALEKLNEENHLVANILPPQITTECVGEDCTQTFKLYHYGSLLELSSVMPIFETLGFRVLTEMATTVSLPDVTLYVHTFSVKTAEIPSESKEQIQACFIKIWNKEIENDGYNRLVLKKIPYYEIVILRAYSHYMLQIGTPFSQQYIQNAFWNQNEIAVMLCNLFLTQFNPDIPENERTELIDAIHDKLEKAFDKITSPDEDRILRRTLNLIHATVRTNYFTKNPQNLAPIALKFDSQKILGLAPPIPYREIFVYAYNFEAVHLRLGKVSRGGLRWSDRPEDFRTEILGLVKAQKVKNSVIVPMGSKGGFVLKHLPLNQTNAQMREIAVIAYKKFIASMLDITDNIHEDTISPPEKVICYDESDPYLVVAADKGTATFSDYANEVSKAYNFWLGDAFASGGSAGYDHKKMGITARGAWESVRSHFLAEGKDPQKDEFTVIGVGDMSGDVFGNGMLLSNKIRLIAAFNHLEIFIDPTPDAKKSFQERKRLFEQPGSAWSDYNPECISSGGGVFSRHVKTISLTPEIKKALNITGEKEKISPSTLISHILKAPVDLLWFGGIGTYVKASYETHDTVGDHGNDGIRISANELNCAVIGEGANLAMTQSSRIEFAQKGGRINTDAIDNSAGVDCSDHEVNIKILFNKLRKADVITEKKRNELLVKMAPNVAQLVLVDNHAQNKILSFETSYPLDNLDDNINAIRFLERHSDLSRSLERIPSDEELEDRRQKRTGLYRPELAVLLAYTKNYLYELMLQSDIASDPIFESYLVNYFPDILKTQFRPEILTHKLSKEIIATCVVNDLVNRCGIGMPFRLIEESKASFVDVARAFCFVLNIFDIHEKWKTLESLEHSIPSVTKNAMIRETQRTVERMVIWLLANDDIAALSSEDYVEHYKNALQHLHQDRESLLSNWLRENMQVRLARFLDPSVPLEIAEYYAGLKFLSSACNAVRLAHITQENLEEIAQIYFRFGDLFLLDQLRSAINLLYTPSHWYIQAQRSTVDQLWQLQFDATYLILKMDNKTDRIEAWRQAQGPIIDETLELLRDIINNKILDFGAVIVAVQSIQRILYNQNFKR